MYIFDVKFNILTIVREIVENFHNGFNLIKQNAIEYSLKYQAIGITVYFYVLILYYFHLYLIMYINLMLLKKLINI